jgi:hypothetical protein
MIIKGLFAECVKEFSAHNDCSEPMDDVDITEDMEQLTMQFIGIDDWDRPIYRDNTGKLWKDVNCGCGEPYLCSATGNDFYGEPDYPISKTWQIVDD